MTSKAGPWGPVARSYARMTAACIGALNRAAPRTHWKESFSLIAITAGPSASAGPSWPTVIEPPPNCDRPVGKQKVKSQKFKGGLRSVFCVVWLQKIRRSRAHQELRTKYQEQKQLTLVDLAL